MGDLNRRSDMRRGLCVAAAALLTAVLAAPPSDVMVMDDGLSMAQKDHPDLGEGNDLDEEELDGEVAVSSSIVDLKATLDRMGKGLKPEVASGDLGESESMGDDRLDGLLKQTCAATAGGGYYDSSSCKPDTDVIRKMIAHLKQREAGGKPLTFKEYGKLETFYAVMSMAELSKIHTLKKQKRLNKRSSHELYEQEDKVLNALHAETEIANGVQRKHHQQAAANQNGESKEKSEKSKMAAMQEAEHKEIQIAKKRLAHAKAAEERMRELTAQRDEQENSLLYKTWTDKGVLQAEQKAAAQGDPERFSKVQDEQMQASKMVTPIMRTVMPSVAVGVKA